MSTLFTNGHLNGHLAARFRRSPAAAGYQFNSWSGLLATWRIWEQRARQRAGLRDIADDPHLLSDLGLTRDEALAQANEPFWR